MKERNRASGVGIDTGEVWTLVQVAPVTGERKVRRGVITAMLLGNDILDMEGSKGDRNLWKLAVFAAPTGSLTNQFSKGVVHQVTLRLASAARARDWRRAIKSTAST